MFGQSKPVAFDPYGSRRKRRRVPPWLLLLLFGIALGVGGVILVQERYLPPRLSAAEGSKLRKAFEDADAARLKLQGELSATSKQRDAALAERKDLADEVALNRANAERLRDDLGAVVSSLPPDPRAGTVGVRAAQFVAKGGSLSYDVVLTRDRAPTTPLSAAMQFVITGDSPKGPAITYSPAIVPVSIGALQVVRGSVALPEGFRPQQVAIQVLDHRGGKMIGMRVMLIGK